MEDFKQALTDSLRLVMRKGYYEKGMCGVLVSGASVNAFNVEETFRTAMMIWDPFQGRGKDIERWTSAIKL